MGDRMNALRVTLGATQSLHFENPLATFVAYTASDARRALMAAHDARMSGAYIAGYLAYDLGEAFADMPLRTKAPLLVLGAFDAPQTAPPETASPQAPLAGLLASVSPARYAQIVRAILASIYDGNVYQVNFTLPFWGRSEGNPYDLWRELARTTQARYQAYVEYDGRAILSWSPELFLEFDGTSVLARPMKGTAPLDRIVELHSSKNRAEHIMIVDLLRNDLHRICTDATVERLFEVERYPTFATMVSSIRGRLRADTSLLDIVLATFPCGSITGAPKRAAMRAIAQLEEHPRDAYCGSIGYLSPANVGWWNVAIRTAQMDLHTGAMRFDAGGGIVADSDPQDEWAEMHLKARFLRDRCGDIELWETLASDADASTVEAHIERLRCTAERFAVPLQREAVLDAIASAQSRERHLLRLRVGRDGNVRTISAPLQPQAGSVPICIARARVRSDDPFLAWKTSQRPAHEVAFEEARLRNCFDALVRNERGELTEGSRTTLFVRIEDRLWTPPLTSGLLPGILRSNLIHRGQAQERVLTTDDLLSAQALYVGNSARGLLAAHLLEESTPT